MKTWLVVAALAVVGCQTATSTTSQEISSQDCYGVANFCDATLPPAASWIPGQPIPQSTPTTVVMLMPGSTWQVFGADPAAGKIHWRLVLKQSSVGAFMLLLTADGDRAYGGVRPPPPATCPPICIHPGPEILAAALRIQNVQQQAEEDAAACPLK